MRLSFVCASAAASLVTVLGVLACTPTSDPSTNSNPDGKAPPPGSDGNVDPDGAVGDPPDTSPAASKVDATNETVSVLGTTRSYVLVVPKSYDASRKYPLIIALHGDGQDGPTFRASLTFDDVAGDDAVVAYPTGAVDIYTPYDQNPDQLLVQATIDDVKTKESIDGTKIWGFGYSKGGFMLNEIGCRKPGVLTAMAIHAGGAPQEPQGADNYPQCPGVVGLPVLETEGELDQAIGGAFGANYWGKVNGCGTDRSDTTPAPCQKTNGCPPDKPVVYCLAPGVSHYPMWNEAVNASWTFFTSL